MAMGRETRDKVYWRRKQLPTVPFECFVFLKKNQNTPRPSELGSQCFFKNQTLIYDF